MLAHVAALVAAALISLGSLPLGESAAIGLDEAHRSSLVGYDVADHRGLDIEEAALLLAERAVQTLDAAPEQLTLRVEPATARPRDLLEGPRRTLGSRLSETWALGDASRARLRALRGSVVGAYVTEANYEGRGFFAGRAKVELTYPAGHPVPAIAPDPS